MRRIALALVAASLFALPAQGAVTLISNTGQVDILGQVGIDPQLPASDVAHFSQSVPRTDSGLFQQNVYDVRSSAQYGTISAMASQVSSFDLAPDGQLTGASFAGTAAVTTATFSPYGSNTQANSTLSFLFQVTDQSVDYTLQVGFFPLNSLGVSAVQLWNTALSTPIEAAYSESATANGVLLTGTLQPGWYQMNLWTSDGGMASTTTNIAWASSLVSTLTLTPAPEPVTLAMLALGGSALLRRRR